MVEVNAIPTLFQDQVTKECGGLHLEERFKNPEDRTCSSAWWQQNGVRLEMVEVVNCLWIICTVMPYIGKKIANSPHNHTRIQLHHIREKNKAGILHLPISKRHITSCPKDKKQTPTPTDNPKDKHSHQSTTHVLVQSSVVCVLARLLQVRAVEKKDAGLLSLLVHIRSIQKKRPNY